MSEIRMCEPGELYNLLNQRRSVSRLAEVNFLWLIDARERQDYNTSHIRTAQRVNLDSPGGCVGPVELNGFQYVVLYDSSSGSLQEPDGAGGLAQVLASLRLRPVLVLAGGFRRFSALYPFLRTEKTSYTIRELEELKVYPLEVLTGRLYLGDQEQGRDASILRDLKITAVLSLSQREHQESTTEDHQVLNISVSDSVTSDLYSSFERTCRFIGSHIDSGSRVLVVSRGGRSRCSAVTLAFLMHRLKSSLREAWSRVLQCEPHARPNTGFLQQLSEWELHTTGTKTTDITQPPF